MRNEYGLITDKDIEKIVNIFKNISTDNITVLKVTNILINRGYSIKLILESFSNYFKRSKVLNEENLCKLYFKISDIDNFSNLSGNQFIATLSILNFLANLLN